MPAIEVVLDSLAFVLCLATGIAIGPLYVRANGTRPLLAGNLAILLVVTAGVCMGILLEEPVVYPIIRIIVLIALFVPAAILTHRKH